MRICIMYMFLNFTVIGVFCDNRICILPATYKGTPADGNGHPEKERILVPLNVFALYLHCICLVFVMYVHCIIIVFAFYLSYICIFASVLCCICSVLQPMAIASQKRKRYLSSTRLKFDCIFVLVCNTVQCNNYGRKTSTLVL